MVVEGLFVLEMEGILEFVKFGTWFSTELNLIFDCVESEVCLDQFCQKLQKLQFLILIEVVFLKLSEQMFPEGMPN